jgi:hypothetical protein
MPPVVYREMSPEENSLDWSVTTGVMSDTVLMTTLEASQAQGEKHAVVAIVVHGEVRETYISPQPAVEKAFPFDPVKQAFEQYDVHGGVCLLIVRDGKAVISINGLR